MENSTLLKRKVTYVITICFYLFLPGLLLAENTGASLSAQKDSITLSLEKGEWTKATQQAIFYLDQANNRIEVLKEEQAYQLGKRENTISDLVLATKVKNNALWFIVFLSVCLGICVVLFGKKISESQEEEERKIKAQEEMLLMKNQSMANMSLINQSKNQLIQHLKTKLQTIYQKSPDKSPELKKVIFQLKTSAHEEEDWERFHNYFTEINPAFYQKLQTINAKLTNLDVRHCALIRLNLSNREAAKLLGIRPKSVQMARYRLKKKLQLGPEVHLKDWMMKL